MARQCSRGRCFRKCPSLTAAREKSAVQRREERRGQPSTLGIAKTPSNDPPANNGQHSELKTNYPVPPPASGLANFVAAGHLRAAVIGFWKYENTGHSPQCRSPHTRTALHMTAAPNGHHPTSHPLVRVSLLDLSPHGPRLEQRPTSHPASITLTSFNSTSVFAVTPPATHLHVG